MPFDHYLGQATLCFLLIVSPTRGTYGHSNTRTGRKSHAIATRTHGPGLVRCALGAWLMLAAAAKQTELQYLYGKLTNPFSAARQYTSILTIQHEQAWRLGDRFFFVDILDDGSRDGFNDEDLYGEWYPTLSLIKLAGTEFRLGPILDIKLIGDINLDADADVLKYLPGMRASWRAPSFATVNTALTAFIDASSGVARGGASRTSNSFMIDLNWAPPF